MRGRHALVLVAHRDTGSLGSTAAASSSGSSSVGGARVGPAAANRLSRPSLRLEAWKGRCAITVNSKVRYNFVNLVRIHACHCCSCQQVDAWRRRDALYSRTLVQLHAMYCCTISVRLSHQSINVRAPTCSGVGGPFSSSCLRSAALRPGGGGGGAAAAAAAAPA